VTKRAPPKHPAPLAPAKPPRAERPKKHQPTAREIADKKRKQATKRDPHDRSHLKTEFTDGDIDAVCELISEGRLSLTKALAKLKFRYRTFKARMAEDAAMDAMVRSAGRDLLDQLMDPGEILELSEKATNKNNSQGVKVRLYARFTLAEKVDPDKWNGKTVTHKGELGHRILGMGQLLKEISDAGADVGPGPSRG
jgi:hypothetical protein